MMVLIQMLTGEVVQGSVFLAGSEVRVTQEIAAPLVEAGKAVFVETVKAEEHEEEEE